MGNINGLAGLPYLSSRNDSLDLRWSGTQGELHRSVISGLQHAGSCKSIAVGDLVRSRTSISTDHNPFGHAPTRETRRVAA